MARQQTTGFLFLAIICSSSILPILAAPSRSQQHNEARKFHSKPNATKKLYHHHHKQLQQQQQQQHQPMMAATEEPEPVPMPQSKQDMPSGNEVGGGGPPGGFPWALAGPLMHLFRMILGIPNDPSMNSNGIDKMDSLGGIPGQGQGFSWGQVIGYGLKLVLAAMGGNNGPSDPIDKMDSGNSSPMQGIVKSLIGSLVGGDDADKAENMAKQTGELFNMAIALMNALKTSFSQRAMRARSLGEKDRTTEIALAAIDMGKAYAKTFTAKDETCKKLYICEAAKDCVKDLGQGGAGVCNFSAFAATNLMYYTQPASATKEAQKGIHEAARRGKSMEDCKRFYECAEKSS